MSVVDGHSLISHFLVKQSPQRQRNSSQIQYIQVNGEVAFLSLEGFFSADEWEVLAQHLKAKTSPGFCVIIKFAVTGLWFMESDFQAE